MAVSAAPRNTQNTRNTRNTRTITILEFASNLSLGGTERAMQEFAIGLDKSRFNVIVGVYDASGPRKAILESHGIRVVTLRNEQIAAFLRKEKVDIAHIHTLRIKEHFGDVPVIQEAVFSGGYDERADVNLPISMALAKKLDSAIPISYGEDYYVLYYPQNVASWDRHRLPQKDRAALRASYGFEDRHLVFGRLGRIEPSKTDFLLLASAHRIAKAIPEARFAFVGLPKLYRAWLHLHPALRGRCVFLPISSEDKQLASYYQLFDVFWHTAERGETFGNVNAEAMIFEKPVLTHSTPFTGGDIAEKKDNAQIEIVDHGKTGLVANYPSEVVAAARQLRSSKTRAALGKAGRAKVLREFDARVVLRQFEAIVRHVLARRERPANARIAAMPHVRVQPSKEIVERFFRKDYAARCALHAGNASAAERCWYAVRRHALYRPIEFAYLVKRYLLRKYFGWDIEKTKGLLRF